MNVNKLTLIGRVTRQPELKTTPTGKTVTQFGVATNHSYKKGDGQKVEETEFHNIVAWGKLAEVIAQWIVKGQEIYIEGRIKTRTYTDKSGIERKIVDVIAENMQMGQKPKNAPQGAPTPAQQPAPAQAQASAPAPTQPDQEENVNVDDIPF